MTLLRRRRAPRLVPEPPIEPLPGRIVHVPGRGEFFLRDSGGDGPALLLLHGWMVSADLNWITSTTRCATPDTASSRSTTAATAAGFAARRRSSPRSSTR